MQVKEDYIKNKIREQLHYTSNQINDCLDMIYFQSNYRRVLREAINILENKMEDLDGFDEIAGINFTDVFSHLDNLGIRNND